MVLKTRYLSRRLENDSAELGNGFRRLGKWFRGGLNNEHRSLHLCSRRQDNGFGRLQNDVGRLEHGFGRLENGSGRMEH